MDLNFDVFKNDHLHNDHVACLHVFASLYVGDLHKMLWRLSTKCVSVSYQKYASTDKLLPHNSDIEVILLK